jgi:hypothetical protein
MKCLIVCWLVGFFARPPTVLLPPAMSLFSRQGELGEHSVTVVVSFDPNEQVRARWCVRAHVFVCVCARVCMRVCVHACVQACCERPAIIAAGLLRRWCA